MEKKSIFFWKMSNHKFASRWFFSWLGAMGSHVWIISGATCLKRNDWLYTQISFFHKFVCPKNHGISKLVGTGDPRALRHTDSKPSIHRRVQWFLGWLNYHISPTWKKHQESKVPLFLRHPEIYLVGWERGGSSWWSKWTATANGCGTFLPGVPPPKKKSGQLPLWFGRILHVPNRSEKLR